MSIPVGWKFYPRFGNVGDDDYAVDLNERRADGLGLHVVGTPEGIGVPDLLYDTANFSTRAGEDLRYHTFGKRLVTMEIDIVGSSKADLDRRYQNLVRRIGLSSGGRRSNIGALVYTRASDSRDEPYDIWWRETDYTGDTSTLPNPLIDVRYDHDEEELTISVLRADGRVAERIVETLFAGIETAQEVTLEVSDATGLSSGDLVFPSFDDGNDADGPIMSASVHRPDDITGWTATLVVTLSGISNGDGSFFDDDRIGTMSFTDDLTLACGVVAGMDITKQSLISPFTYRLPVQWLATDPWWYGPPVSLSRNVGDSRGRTPSPTPSGFSVSTGKFGVTYGFGYLGSAATWSSVLEINGPAENPRLHNLRTGADFKIDGASVADGARLVVIMGPRPISQARNFRAALNPGVAPLYVNESANYLRYITANTVPISLEPEEEIVLDANGEQSFRSQALIYEQDNDDTNIVKLIYYPEFKGA